ncbi:RNA-directed DNA polymerase, eukaryota, reverse transcriptase zinc-binding domain protein [Tanacetum coccineum]|uniref:RNA-directed DNA polymerase, eukaryota, reverse transcriptase zinc-binding domain protein n=1 Tax=Tanacetum coccineum TaxID=301880 RepID=A0ABQ5D724_9ASTR
MDRDYLERLVTHKEIKEAIWDCVSSKAPGPDGFSFAFVKKYWDIIKKDLHDFINSFFASCDMPYGAKSSFITLIPKVNNPTLITNFRPVSLIGIHYKIIAKILANRLSKVIDKIIKTCLSSSRASILVNGSPTSEFAINHGLRQGDPLSPFLFILIMEGLHNAFTDAVGNGLISGININNSSINIPHLFFADDVIITTGWNARDLENIIRVLHVFYLVSGLKINIHKSNIYDIGVNEDEVYNMASNTGCIAGNIPFNYLGLPIGSNMKSIARKVNIFMWRLSLDRLPHRLNLSLREMDILAISCSSCNANVEYANHIFFECIIASDLWKLVYRWCEIPFVQALSIEAFKDWLSSWHAPKEKKHRLFVISTSILWWLWRF